ncbi:MAG TPA: GuaB3 family IMP dehydrogenase-related protein [Acidimicrobiales bacterium]|nr:GuaB3 family IMP dehydrogenase-related protein [Acidimicrobiales bacterium]
MGEVDIGLGRSARVGYALEDLAIVPSRRTRDPDEVDLGWQLDAFRLELPVLVAPLDAVVSPASAALAGRLGALAVLDLEGLWTRHEDPAPLLASLAGLDPERAVARLRELYAAPVRRDLLVARIAELRAAGLSAGAVSPRCVAELGPALVEAELDLLVIAGTVVSAEHVARGGEPLNLKRFIRELDLPVVVGGCASYQAALHLMRTGAVGVLVGVPSAPGERCGIEPVLGIGAPLATAIADAAAARTRHLEETGVYVQVIATGGLRTGAEVAVAIACGADAVMLGAPFAAAREAPGGGALWGASGAHRSLPLGGWWREPVTTTFAELLRGPARAADGRTNLVGALRAAMALCGYASVRELHKAELVLRRPPGR